MSSFDYTLKSVETAPANVNRQHARDRTVMDYEAYCNSCQLVPWPITYSTLGPYLVHFVARQNGCTASLANTKSKIKMYCSRIGIPWLSLQDVNLLKDVESTLRYYDCSEVKRARPLLREHLVRLTKVLHVYKSLDLMLLTQLYVGHDGLLRGGELLSGIKACEIEWHENERGFTICLDHTKTSRGRGGVRIVITGEPGELNAVTLLRMWFDRMNLWDKPQCSLWTGVKKIENVFVHCPFEGVSGKLVWVEFMRSKLDLIGLPALAFTGHSLRAGGATDLFILGMVLTNVMKYGRWKSPEECLVYYRDEFVISEEVSKLFRISSRGGKKT